MNIYTIVIIIGIVTQVCGIAGYLINTQIEITITETIKHTTVVDNETGWFITHDQSPDGIMKDYKFVKR